MYVILVGDDNTLTTTKKQRIMQRSKLVDDLIFLVGTEYNGYQMQEFTVSLEYVLPISRKYRNEILVLSGNYDESHLQYTLPIDTQLTQEAGDIELKLTFLKVELNPDGTNTQRVRKTSSTMITVLPTSAWSDIIPDEALSALDQRLMKTDAQIKALEEMNLSFDNSKADDFIYNEESGEFQLSANNNPIGHKTIIKPCDGVQDNVVVIGPGKEEDDESNSVDVVVF